MGVVYPEHVAMVLNFLCALVVALIFVADINWSGSRASGENSNVAVNEHYSTVSGLIRFIISLECFIEITPDFLFPFMND